MSASVSAPVSSSGNLKIGIVGFGTFAQFLAKAMIKQGHSLRATSRTDYSQLCADLGIAFFSDVAAFLGADNDVIMICTSILSFSQVLKSMPFHSLKQPALFVDVLSVKEHARDTLLRVLPEDSDVLCTHPMFGPESGKHGWRDLNFMYDKVRVREENTCSSFLKIFEIEGCRMLEMSCTKHDELAAKSQFITHTIGRILSEMDIESTPIDTKGFEALVQLRKNTESDSFDLFSGLYVQNRFAKQELKNLELAFEKLKHKLPKRNVEEQEANQ
ncbi:arogenate dehydrogenase 1, chloroplastic-like isoform X1 [Syzygium oleosum]|uniref:arogenate dehydrogenase 1, chloroplastic-like isoform X1 n=1 Tax=Syzygium oleosum TaxID=219896 RepID=UPI0011D1D5ED|nr:arogenate dehydrogenase 1, chloroplastic-like isoform X1 [Syzygium oleosum]